MMNFDPSERRKNLTLHGRQQTIDIVYCWYRCKYFRGQIVIKLKIRSHGLDRINETVETSDKVTKDYDWIILRSYDKTIIDVSEICCPIMKCGMCIVAG